MKLLLSALVLFGLTSFAFAKTEMQQSKEVGNGGDVVTCRDANKKLNSVELLDLYEGRVLHGWNPEMGDKKWTYVKKIDYVLKRLARIAPLRAANYAAWADEFIKSNPFVDGVDLPDVPDSNEKILPRGCFLEQIAIQETPSRPHDRRYIVNNELWKALDENNKAGLVLHEIIYREAIEQGHTNSVSARYFNALVISNTTSGMTLKDFVTELDSLPFTTFDYAGMALKVLGHFYDNGNLRNAATLGLQTYENKNGDFVRTHEDAYVRFYENGNFKETDNATAFSWTVAGTKLAAPSDCGHFTLYEDGKLKRTCTLGKLEWNIQGKKVWVGDSFEFYPHEKMRSTTLKSEETLLASNGASYAFKPYNVMRFFEDEKVEMGYLADPIFIKVQGQKISFMNLISFFKSGAVNTGTIQSEYTLSRGNNATVKAGNSKLASYVRFYENASLESANILNANAVSETLAAGKVKIAGDVAFYQRGPLRSGALTTDTDLVVQGQSLNFSAPNEYNEYDDNLKISFYENGQVSCGHLTERYILETSDGKKEPFSQKVCFDKDQKVIMIK